MTESKSASMECRRCGVCCTRHQASVGPEEIERLASFLEITPEVWEYRYNDHRWSYGDYRLIRHVNGACAFLERADGLAACTVYPVRPDCCAAWQAAPGKKECRQGIRQKGRERPDLF